jgi:pimeloyl-ACP methyl ester carboxylesterase
VGRAGPPRAYSSQRCNNGDAVSFSRHDRDGSGWLTPFLAGVLATGAGWVLSHAFSSRRRVFDPRLIRNGRLLGDALTPVVVVPGIMGSGLCRPDGTRVWLNLRNAIGHYNLSLPLTLPLTDSKDDLEPGNLLVGTDARIPRMFGFTEYYDLLEILEAAGFRLATVAGEADPIYHVFTYDWRRDLVEAARRLHELLERLADERGDPDARFNLVGHSMGGLVARYYLRYGTAEPTDDQPVTWAGARRIRNLVIVATPSGGAIHSLEALLYGSRVGISYTTLAAPVIARMPSVYQLLPPRGAPGLLDHKLDPLDADLLDVETWRRFGWGPFGSSTVRRLSGFTEEEAETYGPFLTAVLERAAALHRALDRVPDTPCPTRVLLVGGDCLPTLSRAVVPEKEGLPPRFEPRSGKETDAMFEAGDGRVTRHSLMAAHTPDAAEDAEQCGVPEASQIVIGAADHHGIYREPTFQSILLRALLRPEPHALDKPDEEDEAIA